MREIKFRAWDKDKKQLFEVCSLSNWSDLINDWECTPQKVQDCNGKWLKKMEIMQYTGLEDKNGKEIYEGDIVKDEIRRWEVCWEQARGQFMRKALKAKVPLSERQIKMYKVKVIGNIYENPELLNT